jgi:2-polyprenyl-6-methoxyphenol hydroxylase-like FAD-dependent oxidoreductase
MPQPTVLVSGAGIAGPALAFWLTRYGYRVVVVESAPGLRPGGQTVDLRGAGADVIDRMGLLDEMKFRSLFQRGAAWVRADGSRRAEMPVEAFDGNGLVSSLEICGAIWSRCCIRPPRTGWNTASIPASRL